MNELNAPQLQINLNNFQNMYHSDLSQLLQQQQQLLGQALPHLVQSSMQQEMLNQLYSQS